MLGNGAVALIGGEAGVGKTRLCLELTAYARDRGVAVAWGHNREGHLNNIGAAWTELLESNFAQAPGADVRSLFGDAAGFVGRVAPSLGKDPVFSDTPGLSPRDEEIRLVDEITRALSMLSRSVPLVLILDDLHWADAVSIELFGQVARLAGDSHLLVAGTYRDVEVGTAHPLTRLLGNIRRERHVHHVPIRALNLGEMSKLLQALAPAADPRGWAQSIWQETAGNPYLAEELIRHLVEVEAFSSPVPAGMTGIDLRGLGVPEGIRQIVAVRLSRLSENAVALLTSASVSSGGVDFNVLQALTGLNDESLLSALDEALDAHFLVLQAGKQETYVFVHEIAREAIYIGQSPSRRVRGHRRMAVAISEVYAGREADMAAELAFQFHESATLPGAAAGIRVALTAAKQATESFAREQAVMYLRIASDLSVSEPPERRLEVLKSLALAEVDALLATDGRRTIDSAIAIMDELKTPSDEVAAFVAQAASLLKDGGADSAEWTALVNLGLKRVTDADRLTWARLTLLKERFEPSSSGLINAARWLGNDLEAVEIARGEGNEDDYARTLQPFDQFDPRETAAMIDRIETWERPTAIIRGLTITGAGLLYHYADFRRARRHFERLLEVSEHVGSVPGQAEALVRLAKVHCALGEFTAAQDAAGRARELVTRLLPEHRLNISLVWVDAYLAEYLGGDWRIVATALTDVAEDPRTVKRTIGLDDAAFAALALVRSGQSAAAQRMIDTLTPLIEQVDSLTALANGAVALGAAAVWALERSSSAQVFQSAAESLLAAGFRGFPCTSLELTVARMATLNRDRAAAEHWFQEARVALDREGQLPLRAIVDLDEARTLVKTSSVDTKRIESLLDSARASFKRLEMHDWAVFCDVSVPKTLRDGMARGPARPAGLTIRELEVLHLVSRGYSDRQISEELYLSPRTVNAHIRNMLSKTQNSNRTELSVWAMRNVTSISSTASIN